MSRQPVPTRERYLVEIDPTDYQVAVGRAQADYADAKATADAASVNVPVTSISTSSQLSSADADVLNAQAGIQAAQQQFDTAKAEPPTGRSQQRESTKRSGTLQTTGRKAGDLAAAIRPGGSCRQGGIRRSGGRACECRCGQCPSHAGGRQTGAGHGKPAHRGTAPRQVTIVRAHAASALAAAARKKADLDQAQLNLSYTKIIAPLPG